jgi:hypothetical protein
MPKKVYTCTHCGVVQITPEQIYPTCVRCGSECEETPEATLNFVVARRASDLVKRLTEIKGRYADEALR